MRYSRLKGLITAGILAAASWGHAAETVPIEFGFLWHMHQPIYYPYESLSATAANNRYTFDVLAVHNDRYGPYTTWPKDAVSAGSSLPNLGAQVSFSGSLVENLNTLRANNVGSGMWSNWESGYRQGIGLNTTLGNSRLDMVAFGYHHPLMPLLDHRDMVMQIKLHKHIFGTAWNGAPYSKGMFPAENAFSDRMIPALIEEGIEWVMVDNIHFDRACKGYPHTNATSLFAPNRADQINPNPSDNGGAWVQLQNLWAPSRVSAPFGYQPHHVQYVDPHTGDISRVVAVPTARYEGNEDGRGGYGAFLYDTVMDALLPHNTDPNHPILVLLHHDGDNHGGGTDSYYHHNFNNMVSWVSGDPDYNCTTVQDYLERFPVAPDDVIHVEPGSWAGADAGDPEFKKWLGDPNSSGWSPDRNSWAVMTAARNRVYHADDLEPHASIANIINGTGTSTEKAWHNLLCGQASDYWYWDGSPEPWDSNVTRACNLAVGHADTVIDDRPDVTAPAIFVPQREPYNPGGYEWGSSPESSDFEVWTYAYDVSGLVRVELKWRTDKDGENPIDSIQNETFAGGDEVNAWNTVGMAIRPHAPRPSGVLDPTHIADLYFADITGQSEVLIDYFVEAEDSAGNVTTSDIFHVYVGQGDGGGGTDSVVSTIPSPLQQGRDGVIRYNNSGRPLDGQGAIQIHYGVNNWQNVTDAAMAWNATSERWEVTLPMGETITQFDCVFHNGSGLWDNNDGKDWHLEVVPAPQSLEGFMIR